MKPEEQRQKDLHALRMGKNSPEAYAAVSEAVHDRQRNHGFLVVLARHKELPHPDYLKAFADAMDLDVYTARQRLLAPTARVIRRENAEEEARAWAEWLGQVDLRAFAVSEKILSEQQFIPQAAIYMEKDNLVFDDLQDVRTTVPLSEVACVVTGEVYEKLTSEANQTGVFSADELLVRRDTHFQRNEHLIDIHLRSTPISLRLAQDTFRFKRLFPNKTGASAVLIRELWERLRRALPGKPMLDDFAKAQNILGTTEQIISSSSYLESNWARPGVRVRNYRETKVLESTAETFDIYSTLARLEAVQLAI